ncbi:MAG: HAMP domain-containing protein [Gammaproteobacteria bacterium]|nr:HAMP domain-containing protein [Gammaproteobacteria bacterium]
MRAATDKNPSHFSLGIRARIFLGFLVIAIILVITTLFVSTKINEAALFSKQISTIDFPNLNDFLDLNGQVYKTQAVLSKYIITHNEFFKKDLKKTLELLKNTRADIDKFSKNWKNIQLINNWETAKTMLDNLEIYENELLNSFSSMSPSVLANTLSNQFQPKVSHVYDVLDGPIQSDGVRRGGIYDQAYNEWESIAATAEKNLNLVNHLQYGLVGFYVIIAILIAFFTSRSILTPLNKAINIARQIAEGERNISIISSSKDETGALLTSLDIMLNAIKENELKLQQSQNRTRTLFENIVKTANTFSEHSSRVAKGDLSQRITNSDNKEMKQLGEDLNKMTDNLSTITQQITEACHNMVSTLEEVKQSVIVQSSGATEQASSINEITASLEEIEKSSSQTIEKAKALGEVAERTRTTGQRGIDAVEQSTHGMKTIRDKVQIIAQTILELSNQTQQVGEITHVVNTLAQQSKMLALNASIEAAKAGEAGKGFAVVAAEVKSLAEQSEHSTSQVQKILEDIRHATEKAVMATEEGIKGVDEGTHLVEQTGNIVRNLSDVIHETTIASEQIAAAIRQEGVGIEQITAGMNEINQVTSSFVASVKQTTEAMEDLSSIAKNLKEHVDTYRI